MNRKHINHHIPVLRAPFFELIIEVEFVPVAVMKSHHANALSELAENDFQQIRTNFLRVCLTMSINILLSVVSVGQ